MKHAFTKYLETVMRSGYYNDIYCLLSKELRQQERLSLNQVMID